MIILNNYAKITKRCLIISFEPALNETTNYRGFSNTAVADTDDFGGDSLAKALFLHDEHLLVEVLLHLAPRDWC